MTHLATTSVKVSDSGICPYCTSKNIVKNGRTSTKKQQYHCKSCRKRFLDYYSYKAYGREINHNIISLTKEGVGIRSTARLLQISTSTVISKIKKIAKDLKQPEIAKGKTYEVDELCTYVKKKKTKSG
jgi:insertion element IS1 protein InsB